MFKFANSLINAQNTTEPGRHTSQCHVERDKNWFSISFQFVWSVETGQNLYFI